MVLRRIGVMTAVLGISTVLLTGCGLFGPEEETRTSIDPPPLTEDGGVEIDASDAIDSGITDPDASGTDDQETSQTINRTVYLLDANDYVVPVTLPLPQTDGPAKQVLSYMVKGGPVEELLPQGFAAILPEGTNVLGANILEGTVTVDFSPEFTKYAPEQEEEILHAITRALTQFDSIENVEIWVNGTPLSEMPVNKTPITALNQSTGINLELAEGATPGRTSAVTVYFQGQLDQERTYYVPVTRLIPETDDVARAVVEELIRGPKEGSPLFSSLLGTTEVISVEKQDETVVVNLSDDVLKYNNGKEANPEAMQSLVLSLTENTGANKVQVMVEGKPLTTAGSYDFSKPVVRPMEINSFAF
ncbi:GerMN domain-containing protein [Brevibacillus humidisoli]|uniref:GerMN domain-containing protein n=1 Tax=Brevibacillus humidisoli TaxID=2895522 RepID=UPI001E2E41F3|nr:GerMN domain-containing protein [Brevibacillus humidisoli]UFJ39095.1 GerMN domain-containing protein [Brevibacillus humidisoli]